MKGYNLDNSFKEKIINQFNNEYGLSFSKASKEEREKIKANNNQKHKYLECISKKVE